jgi:hypothetical protein
VDAEYRARAEERRRRGMLGGVAKSHEELDAIDLEFWLSVEPRKRIAAACLLQEEARRLRGDGPFSRLQGSPGGVRRLGS